MRPAITALFAIVTLASSAAGLCRAQEFQRHVVVAQEEHAAKVGRDILRQGGNAVDAAVATAFALAVTHPAAGNIGGGGFFVYYDAAQHRASSIEFREAAPTYSSERMYLDEQGKLVRGHRAGPRAAGVPGTVRGLELAHDIYGSKPWEDLVWPAVALARDGFVISGALARSLNSQLRPDASPPPDGEDLGPGDDRLAQFASSARAFGKPDGKPWEEGDRLIQRHLAETLERIATEGADSFYRGWTADLIADYCDRHGGLITRADLAAYRAFERAPVQFSYKGNEIYSVGPPSSGGVVLGLTLKMVEPFDLKADGFRSPRTLHRLTEAMRRAYFVRAAELGDGAGYQMAAIASHARNLAETIDDAKATPSTALAPFHVVDPEPNHTTHLSVLDEQGNAVALTYTLEEGYGCKAVVEGAGFLLNNEMGDFNLIPGLTDTRGQIGTAPNRIAPGKRMLSSQTPTIVVKDGRVRLVTGSPGGRTIPNTVACVVLQVVEFELSPADAIRTDRIHHAWLPDTLRLEGANWDHATRMALEKLGHKVVTAGLQGNANSIVIDPKTRQIHGVADARRAASHAAGD